MSALGRPLLLSLGLLAVALVAGCGSTTKGIPDSKIRPALQMKSIQGHLAIQGNPFCSTSKLLHDSTEVKDARSTHLVIASRDQTVGVQIIKPFAPSCRNFAQKKLDRLAGEGKHHKHKKGKKKKAKGKKKKANGKQKGGGGGG